MIKAKLAISGCFLMAVLSTPVSAQAYRDLPGVVPSDPLDQADRLVCEQEVVKTSPVLEPTRGPRYLTMNNCSRNGGPVFTSPRLPPSIERQLRGLNY